MNNQCNNQGNNQYQQPQQYPQPQQYQQYPNNYQPQQYQYAYQVQPLPSVPGKGMAIASMSIGIVSLVLSAFFFWLLPLAILCIILGIIGIVLGGVAKSKGYRGGMASAGLATSIIAVVLSLLLYVVIGVGACSCSRTYYDEYDFYEDLYEELYDEYYDYY